MRSITCLVVALVCSAAFAAGATQRTLTFEERVAAQTAIERVYYGHQLGATKSFEDTVPAAVIEGKVHKYLEQTIALNMYWHTAVTDQTLQRELERMARDTKMPERLQELYAALPNDPFLIKECLARPMLVDRLTHNFYMFDKALHAEERSKAEQIHARLASGKLDPAKDVPGRTVTEISVDAGSAEPDPVPTEKRLAQSLTLEEFQRRRAELPLHVGQASPVKEARDAFAISVVLSETATSVRVANYVIAKNTWDSWWDVTGGGLRLEEVNAVASETLDPKALRGITPNCSAIDTWDNGILDDSPEGRSSHTAVWTGSVVIVWGGEGSYANSGSRYDPATDTWQPVSMVGAPSARTGHTAIWTGTSMIVWGGRNDTGTTNTGGRYDPITDKWTPTSSANAPSSRYEHSAVWSGTEMIVWGGLESYNDGDTNTGARYDPAADTWVATSTVDAPYAAGNHAAVWAGHEMIVWTGEGRRYDPATDSWHPVSSVGAPETERPHSVVWTGKEMLVWGGYRFGFPPDPVGFVNTGAKYNPSTDTWAEMSTENAPISRTENSAIWTGKKIAIWGGWHDSGYMQPLNDGGLYDPDSNTWTPMSLAGAPVARMNHSATWTGSTMVVWGGSPSGGGGQTNTGARYDPNTDTWTPTSTGTAPPGRSSHTGIWTGNLAVVWGGQDEFGFLDTGWKYDPALDVWIPTSSQGAPAPRSFHTAVWTGSEMIVWGGTTDATTVVQTGGRYNPTSDSWVATSSSGAPSARVGHTAVWSGSRMVIWGGYGYVSGLSTGGQYDPATDQWMPTSMTAAPQGRYLHTAVWLDKQRLMVVWGGQVSRGSVVNTGGTYDPASDTWTATSLNGAPRACEEHAAISTGNSMIVWGGYAYSATNSGGQYDPTTNRWSETSLYAAPSARYRPSAVWTGHEMIVWGGAGNSPAPGNTGGRYVPETHVWTPTSLIGAPAGRWDHIALWTGHQMMVWGGGQYSSSLVDSGGLYTADSSHDSDHDGYTLCDGDCNDADPAIHPGADDVCDGIDNDCSGTVDDRGNALCDDGNVCTDDICAGTAGCLHANNSVPCDDANACTQADTCSGGVCVGVAVDGIPCNDGNACTASDVCLNGHCAGTTIDCDDHNVCTNDGCEMHIGCYHAPNANACSDGSACTVGDHCVDGACQPGTAIVCNDGNACTDDSCDPATGACVFTNDDTNACTDGNPCTQTDTCQSGVCIGSNPKQCNAGCPDGSTMVGGLCQKTYDIDASNLDNLAPYCSASSSHTIQAFSGYPYGFHWTDQGGSPATVTRVDVQLGRGVSCGPTTLQVSLNGGASMSFGTGFTCQCPPLSQLIALSNLDSSRYALGGLNTIKIDGAYYSQGLSRIFSLGNYFARVTVTYAPLGNTCRVGACGISGFCNFVSLPNGTSCEDGNACTSGERCGNGRCVGGAPIACDDGNPCTVNACDPATGCIFPDDTAVCDDHNACTDDVCSPTGGCTHTDTTGRCQDGNPCTTDGCDPATGCTFTNNTDACDDGNPCTTNDTCGVNTLAGYFAENFDGVPAGILPTGWVSSIINLGTPWTTVSTSSASAPNSAFAPDSPAIATEILETPAITMGSGRVRLTFRNRWSFEDEASCWDGGVLEIQIGSSSYVDILDAGGAFVSGGYTGTILNYSTGNPLAGRAAWCLQSPGYPNYITTAVDLPAYVAGQVVNLRWRIGSDDSVGAFGQNIDSIELRDPVNACLGGPPLDCDDGKPCTDDSCSPQAGCVHTISCDDHNPCTDDVCGAAGACVFIPNSVSCDDGNACTSNDVCANGSCHGTSNPDGSSCNDGNACTSNDACRSGLCAGGPPLDCNDDNPCTTDSCNPSSGCAHANNTNECDDGNACTSGDRCRDGSCHGTAIACDDNNPCTDDRCEPSIGCVFANNSKPCDDSSVCTVGDTCQNGACRGTPIVCDDHDVCTTNDCDPVTGCFFVANTNSCDDGNACTTEDRCGPSAGSLYFEEGFDGVAAPSLPSGWTSSVIGQGSPWVTRTGSSETAPNSIFALESSLPADAIIESPSIAIGSPTATLTFRNRWSYEDSGICYDGGVLEIKIGAGAFTDILAAGGSFTSGGYTGFVELAYGNPLAGRAAWCNDSIGYPAYLTTTVNLPPTAAGQTVRFRWRMGSDSSTAAVGQDIDSVVIADATTMKCNGGPPPDCDDGNPCTTDSCNPASGCVHVATPGIACNDGNACTINDICSATGMCMGLSVGCNDDNPCTDDTCNPATGCVHVNNTASCDDGNPCTAGDACGGGTCHAGSPVVCVPSDSCHLAGVCNPANGSCSSSIKPDGTACNDGNLCTTGDVCTSGVCSGISHLNEPHPKTIGYYKELCAHAHDGDQLTTADAACLADSAATFDTQTVADLCLLLGKHDGANDDHDDHPDASPSGCDKARAELVAFALNRCRARVCDAQQIDSDCAGSTSQTVGQSFQIVDGSLSGASPTNTTCKYGQCLAKEINSGHAFEIDDVHCDRDDHHRPGGIRCHWSVPRYNDGTTAPAGYDILRRPHGSGSFTRVASVATPEYYVEDPNNNYDYDVVPVE